MMLQNNSVTQILLSPRRQEIVAIIHDHPYISFDAIARRFPTIPKRTLAYDVTHLFRNKYIARHGVTRGACYSAMTAQSTA